MTTTTRRRFSGLRRLITLLAAAGLLGGTLQAQAHVERERQALEARVAAVRQALQDNDSSASGDVDGQRAQWFNWGNWNNWNNWRNWGNWLNR